MKTILINSTGTSQTQIATLNDGKLVDLDIENTDREQKKSNIYKGYISKIEPSLSAVFVNYGENKNGFLPFKEISEYYLKDTSSDENISHLLSEGQELIVQINKEERGHKGAALTTFITLAGSYIVLLPNSGSDAGGVSRKVEGEDRERLKMYLKDLNIPTNMSIIARTACVECSFEELKYDFEILTELWESIIHTYHKVTNPVLLHKESNIIIRTVRDHFKEDIEEIIVNDKECFDYIKRQLNSVKQSFDTNKVKLYKDKLPLFTHYNIDQQIENAYKREIRLPSGGSIVIDLTEALTAIDVNSSKATAAGDVESTALKTNLEAATEVARQLKIRDLGGLVVIDFIDMASYFNRQQVEEKLIETFKQDKARIQMSRISKLGLIEISRQRLNSPINENLMQQCPRCKGFGSIKNIQSTALDILRKINTEVAKEHTNEVRVQAPVDITAYLLNEKRTNLIDIENNLNIKITIIPNLNLESPKFQVQRIWGTHKSNQTSPELIKDKNFSDIEIPKTNQKQIALKNSINNINSKPSTSSDAIKINSKHSYAKDQRGASEKSRKNKGVLATLFNFIFDIFNKDSKNQTAKNKESHRNNNKTKNEKAQTNSQSPQDRSKDNSQNNTKNNNYNSRHKNKTNDTFSKRPNNKSYNKSSNINVSSNEKIVDITKIKYESQTANPKNNIKKTISQNPEEFISVMVKDVLKNYDSLKSENATKVITEEKITTQKYLKFDTVYVDAELAAKEPGAKSHQNNNIKKTTSQNSKNIVKQKTNTTISDPLPESDTAKTTNESKTVKKDTQKSKQTAKEKDIIKKSIQKKVKDEHIKYSAAIDFESQA